MIRAVFAALSRWVRPPADTKASDPKDHLRRGARRANHMRWHERRAMTAEGCEFCPPIAVDRQRLASDSLATDSDSLATIHAQISDNQRSPISIDTGSKNQIDISPDRPHLAALRQRGEHPSLRQQATYETLVDGQGGDEAASRWMAALIRGAPPRLRGPRLHGHVWAAANALRRRPLSSPGLPASRRAQRPTLLADDELTLTAAELAEIDRELNEVPG